MGVHDQEIDWEKVGFAIMVERRSRKLTSNKLAEDANTNRTTISLLEHGKKPGISVAVLWRIVQVLCLSLDTLLQHTKGNA